MLPSPQETLAQRLKAGEDAAFHELITTHGPCMLQMATRLLGNREDAQDCLQETFLQVYRKIDTFRGESALTTWIHRILVNTCLMKTRTHNHNQVSIDTLLPEFDNGGCRLEPNFRFDQSIEDMIAQHHVRAKVLDSIHQLPDHYRAVLLLRDIEGYSTAEVCEMLSLSESAVKVRLHRARAALKKLLEPLWMGGHL